MLRYAIPGLCAATRSACSGGGSSLEQTARSQPRSARSGLLAAALFAFAATATLPHPAAAQDLTVNFATATGSPICGMPAASISGKYTFRDLPPLSTGTYLLDSFEFSINGGPLMVAGPGTIELANDIPGPGFFRDRYSAFSQLPDLPFGSLLLQFVFLQMESDSISTPNPALMSLDLPTTDSQLAGFGGAGRVAGVQFLNTSTNQSCVASAALTGFSFEPNATPDTTPPQISLVLPYDGARFTLRSEVSASYSCSDNVAIATCVGTLPNGARIDTRMPGNRTFTVTATDTSGLTTSRTVTYSVLPANKPTLPPRPR